MVAYIYSKYLHMCCQIHVYIYICMYIEIGIKLHKYQHNIIYIFHIDTTISLMEPIKLII